MESFEKESDGESGGGESLEEGKKELEKKKLETDVSARDPNPLEEL